MENIWEITQQSTARNKKWYKIFIHPFCVTIIICICLSIVIAIPFIWKHSIFEFGQPISADRWGQYGDFFGGLFGTLFTLFSVFLLYKAFIEQRKANEQLMEQNKLMRNQENERLYQDKLQQFESNFNRLLMLYQEAVLAYKSGETIGKAYLANKISDFVSSIVFDSTEAYTKRVSAAYSKFEPFITNHRTLANAHMRMLYQLLCYIETSDIKEKDKIPYAKTLRGQLIDEELILIRYNCISKEGYKMQSLVFHYNILKHLPFLNLFEFKQYRRGLSNKYINRLNAELITWRKNISTLFREGNTKPIDFQYGGSRYKLAIYIEAECKSYNFVLKKEPKTSGRVYEMMVKVLDSFSNDALEHLLWDFHTEIFRISHFRQFNRSTRFRITHDVNVQNNVTTFSIKATNDLPIIASYFQIQNPTAIKAVD